MLVEGEHEIRRQGILALLPFFAQGSLSLIVLREMRARGLDITLANQMAHPAELKADPLVDFRAADRVIDLSAHALPGDWTHLARIVDKCEIGLILLIGAPGGYAQLSRLRERRRDIRLLDWLFNTGPHFHSFSLRAGCFDGVLVESVFMRDRLAATPDIGRIWQIESGVDLQRFRPVNREISSPKETFILGYFGRMSPEKNPLGFVEMAERIHTMSPSTRFVMYGAGGQAEDVALRIAASQARGAIRFAGYVEDPCVAYAAMDVLVVPSLLDGRPATIIEANACGLPVIASAVGGIPQLIEEGRNGHLVSPRNPERMVSLIAGWLADPESFMALQRNARGVAEARFNRSAMLDGYEVALRESLATPARRVLHIGEL